MRREPFVADTDFTLWNGDALEVLREMPDASVHMCCTSPPFYGLRDYGTGSWEGGDESCDHAPPFRRYKATGPKNEEGQAFRNSTRYTTIGDPAIPPDTCGKCGATRVDHQIGLEADPSEWVERLVAVFREVRRVLRDDGTLWVEIGDSYCGAGYANNTLDGHGSPDRAAGGKQRHGSTALAGVKPKDMIGQPWLLAFALRADGWYLRSEIIWAKPNPMPESVTDRPTKSHSTVFLLAKRPRYFFDADAIREASIGRELFGNSGSKVIQNGDRQDGQRRDMSPNGGANARSVWTIPTQPTPYAHFATWPEKLCARMILAGTSERGVCPECRAPWVREIAATGETNERDRSNTVDYFPEKGGNPSGIRTLSGATYKPQRAATGGWSPSCAHQGEPVPAVVLDPFGGSGTTALVARRLGRRSILVELNAEYAKLAADRLQQLSLLT